MKTIIFYLFLLMPFIAIGQASTYTISGTSLTTCASATSTGTGTPCGLNYDAGNIKFASDPTILNTTLTVVINKCSGANTTGSVYLKMSSSSAINDIVCGTELNSASNRTIGTATNTSLSADLSSQFTSGTRYFTVVFINSSNVRSYTKTFSVTATPPTCTLPAPSIGSASNISTSGFRANWNAVSGAYSYTVNMTTIGGSYPGTQVTVSNTNYDFFGLSSNTQYKYQVRANCSNGLSGPFGGTLDYPTTLSLTCTVPSGLSTSNITETGYTATWAAVAGASSYSLESVLNSNSYTGNLITTSSNSYTFSNIPNGTYKFQVRANCSNGVSSVMSGSLTGIQLPPPLAIPSLTSPINSQTTSSTSVTLQWSKNGNSTGVDYQLRLRNVTDNIVVYDYTSLNDVSSTTVSLQNGKEYSWVIRARKTGNSDKESAPATFFTPAATCSLTLPAANTGTSSNFSSTGFAASWPAVSGATEYQINVTTFNNTTYSAPLSFTGSTTTNSINVTGLSPATQYRYQIRAKCANGVWTVWSPTLDTPTTPSSPPDFTVSAVSLSSQSVQRGNNVQVNYTINNLGGTTSANIRTRFFLSTNTTYSADDTELNFPSDITNGLGAGASLPSNTQVNIPTSATAGSKYVIVFVDGNSQITESNENNNTSFAFITITDPLPPDLQVSNLSLNPASVQKGGTFTLNYTFSNPGGAAGAFDVRFYLSSNSSYDANDTQLDIFSVSSYAGGGNTQNLSRSLTIPSTANAGGNYILVVADLNDQIAESNESNNRSFVFITVTDAPFVNVSSPAANSTYQTGATLPITYAFTGYTGNVSIEITAGTNGTVGILPAIADNEPNTGSKSWLIPTTFAPGQYRIKVYNTGAGTGGNPTIVNYSGVFNIGTGSTCPTCPNFNLTLSSFPLTGQEGLCAAQYLCNSKIIQPNQPNPTNLILREDVAKIALLSGLTDGDIITVSGGGGSFPADFFPTTFTDLFQGTTAQYHRYAKILSYFQGTDATTPTTPFDRYKPFPNNDVVRPYFNPTDNISRIDLLKVYLETWNIDETSNGNQPLYFNDISGLTPDQSNYLKKAVQLGLVQNGTAANLIAFRPYDINGVSGTATREEAFLILYRLRALANQTKPDFTLNSNYYQPANQSIGNLSIYKGLTQGNFSHHTSTDFGINDIGFSLNFAHSYQSFMTLLPDEWKVVQPLGYGWTHPYNVYMFTTVQINDASGAVAGKPLLVLAWGDGTFDVYDNTNVNSPTPITIGTNYNILTRVNSTSYTIKTKSQHVYTFNQQGSEAGLYRLTNIKDRYNNTLSIVYKAGTVVPFSPVSQVIDYVQAPSGRRINFTYDTQNRITNVNFPGSSTNTRNLTFAYTNKNLTSFKDAKGQSTGKTTTYTYGTGTEIYLLKQIAFPRGNKIENVYDPNSRLQWTQARDADNNITAKTQIDDPGQYDNTGSFKSKWTQNCSCPNSQSEAKYDKNGITTEFQNKVIKVLSPASANHPSMPSAVTYSTLNGSNPQTYTPTYDSNGNVLSISRPDGKSETFTYDAYHNRRTHTDAKNITTTYNWSSDGKFLNSIVRPIDNGSNLTQSFSYQTNGLMSSSTNNENIVTNFGYDARGNMNSIQIPVLGISSSAVYDFASRMTSNTNARGKTTTYLFDDNDNLTRETDPLSRQTNYGYDDNDNLTTITNAKNEVTTLGYDGFDRLISETFGGKTKTYVYDNGQNRLTEFRKAGYANNNAKRFSYTYDANNRLYGNGYITEIGYDPLNRMSSIKGGTQATHQLSNFSYDALNRLTGYTDAWNNTVGYGYDDNGNETRIDYPNGNKLYKTYDNLNRLKTVSWNTILVATYNYVGSRLDNVVYGNNVKTQYSYDNAGRPTGISTKTNNGTGGTIYAATFTLDNLGNHTEENETQPFATLPVPTAGTTSSTFTNNKINNLGSTNFTHDDDGNITAKGSSTYGYDLEDNLISYTGSGLTMTALYDAFGNRRSVTRNGTETRYVLDINGLATVLAETNGSNTVQNYYLHGLGLVARVKADGTLHYYHGDFRGSTIALTNTSQTITHKYQYDEFGNLTNSQEADPNPFRYVGTYGIMHESPDLTYMRARYYDPTTGRFNSEDPIWSTNLYPYAGNNGVINIDINGQSINNISELINWTAQSWWNSKHVSKQLIDMGVEGYKLIQSNPRVALALLYGEYYKRLVELSVYGFNARYASHVRYIEQTLVPLIRYTSRLIGLSVTVTAAKFGIAAGAAIIILFPGQAR
ncbi:RHS repeat-associated protein [Runella defluvii]|uniref:RHS repeat-associated protein n=1 Tax=Runella defluvii TaxID=370973 RepID=A0A7W6EPC5_9BACT|nr:CARDB domain-containing protein [Runella defluvii]MBB3837212.1 RHS repeat-associated protein [Runella defluvii]